MPKDVPPDLAKPGLLAREPERTSGRERIEFAAHGALVKIGRGVDIHANTSRVRQWFEGEYETTTDANGAYSFDGIGQPEWFRMPPLISAVHDSLGAWPVQPLPEGDATVDFVVLGSGTINGSSMVHKAVIASWKLSLQENQNARVG